MSQAIHELHAQCQRECPLGGDATWIEINAYRRKILPHVVQMDDLNVSAVSRWLVENIGLRLIAIPEDSARQPRDARWEPGSWDWLIGTDARGAIVFDFMFFDHYDATAFKMRWK